MRYYEEQTIFNFPKLIIQKKMPKQFHLLYINILFGNVYTNWK